MTPSDTLFDGPGEMRGGESTWHEDQLVPILRNGKMEDVWWTYGFGPAPGDDGRVAGVLVVCTETTRRVQSTHEVGRLLAESERQRADADLARQRTEGLQSLTAALSSAASIAEIAAETVAHASDMLTAAGTVVARVSHDGGGMEILHAHPLPDDVRAGWRHFPLTANVPLADVARTGEPVFLESRDAWVARYPALAPLVDALGHHANMVVPLVVDGNILGALGVAFDVPRTFDASDRATMFSIAGQCAVALERARLFEAEQHAHEEAERANRAKGEFLAVMSHELRTPLNAIGGYAELMELGIRGPITAEQREDLHRIQQSQRHLLGLINQVLNYARVDAGAVRYDVVDVTVSDELAAAEALVMPQMRTRRLRYVVGETDPALIARADREKLQQVLLNLLTNAIKFTEEGGEIRVSARGHNGKVLVAVADTGIGIAPEKCAAVFDPFVQVHSGYTRTNEGVGLGLAISRELARGMSGDLTMESTLGVGSTFTITLPCRL